MSIIWRLFAEFLSSPHDFVLTVVLISWRVKSHKLNWMAPFSSKAVLLFFSTQSDGPHTERERERERERDLCLRKFRVVGAGKVAIKVAVPVCPTNFGNNRAMSGCAYSWCGIRISAILLFIFSPFFWNAVRFKHKYCFKEPLAQTTNNLLTSFSVLNRLCTL